MNESTPPDQQTSVDWMDTWEHPPVRGPAVFVADRRTLDDFGSLWGGWVDPTQPPEALAAAIEQTVGPAAAAKEAWVITDQLDLGSTMIPEQLSVRALHRYARFQTGDHDTPVRLDATSVNDVIEHLPCDRWDDASDLARDIIITTGLLTALGGLPRDWEDYVEIDLLHLGIDAAQTAGLEMSDDGEITRQRRTR